MTTSPEPEKGKREAERLRAQKPRGLLFLCVASSAPSQIAGGIARSRAPGGVTVFSAGLWADPGAARGRGRVLFSTSARPVHGATSCRPGRS